MSCLLDLHVSCAFSVLFLLLPCNRNDSHIITRADLTVFWYLFGVTKGEGAVLVFMRILWLCVQRLSCWQSSPCLFCKSQVYREPTTARSLGDDMLLKVLLLILLPVYGRRPSRSTAPKATGEVQIPLHAHVKSGNQLRATCGGMMRLRVAKSEHAGRMLFQKPLSHAIPCGGGPEQILSCMVPYICRHPSQDAWALGGGWHTGRPPSFFRTWCWKLRSCQNLHWTHPNCSQVRQEHLHIGLAYACACLARRKASPADQHQLGQCKA